MTQAVLAIEDRRYYQHPGIDPIGIAGALFSYATGRRAVLAGGSTITQQLIRNVFLPKFEGMTLKSARVRSLKRKLLEQFLAVVLTSRASKDDILEMYLNDVPLGQRGSFAIFGVAEASRLFFGKDVSNVSLAEAATIAGVIQSPSALSPFNNAERCKERRNVVLQAMVDAGFVDQEAADRAVREPFKVVERALEAEAPHFVDFVDRSLDERYPGLTTTTTEAVDVYTTLDLHLQRIAQDAVRNGLTQVDKLLSRRKRKGRAEAALIAVDPKNGEILAFVGGRSYNQSQFNRVMSSRRQPGSVFKPFVYLAAFEQAAADGRTDITPATIVQDEPETFEFDDQVWEPANYQDEYEGPITFRRALAMSRNLATIHVAQMAGYDNIANLWKKMGVGTVPKPYPSIALGVFEATPFEIATAYTIFPNMGRHPPAHPSAENHPRRHGHHEGRHVSRGTAARSREARHDVPRHEHDAQRDQRRHRRRGADRRVHARRRGQDRHDQRSARRLVRRVHARAAHGRLGRLRRQPARRLERCAGGPADLDRVHEARARRALQREFQGTGRHRLRRYRPRYRQAGHLRLPSLRHRGLHRRHTADRLLREAPIPNRAELGRSARLPAAAPPYNRIVNRKSLPPSPTRSNAAKPRRS